MKQVFVRPAKPSDAAQFLEWQKQQLDFDPAVTSYPDSFTLCAFDHGGPVAYMPVQQSPVAPIESFVLESIAFRPGLSELHKAAAMKELFKTSVFLSLTKNVGEIYFVGTNPETNAFAERHGLEKLPWPVYRLRLADMEQG